MPAPTTSLDFVEGVRKSNLIDSTRLDDYLSKLDADGKLAADPRKLATRMIRDGFLSYFHCSMLLQGKSKGFRVGNYQVLERLGSGGMGNVYLCHHMTMKRCVAIKVLPTDRSREHVSRERFKREARAIAGLDHPNIVRAYDLAREGDLHYIVMEFVEGVSLTALVRQKGPLELHQSCHYISQAALGLQHAYEAGLIHRDIKPENLLVTPTGQVKILDMGLVLFRDTGDEELTARFEKGSVLGTVDYLAPEQAIDSHSVDVRADIYSLGATFYFLLTGRSVFGDGTVAQKLLWHQMRAVEPIRRLRPEVPEELDAIVLKMLAKKPEDRYGTPAEVAAALVPWTQTPIPPPNAEPTQRLSPLALGLVGSETREAPTHHAILHAIAAFKTEAEKATERTSRTRADEPPPPLAQPYEPQSPQPTETHAVPVSTEPPSPGHPRTLYTPSASLAWVVVALLLVILMIVIGVLAVMLLNR